MADTSASGDRDIGQLPQTGTVNPGDLLLKWDGTQTSGQRTQSVSAQNFAAYVQALVAPQIAASTASEASRAKAAEALAAPYADGAVATAVSALQARTDVGGFNFQAAYGARATTRTAFSKASDGINLMDFAGTSDVARLQNAHDALGMQAGVIDLPARDIVLDPSIAQLAVSYPITLRGKGWSEIIGASGTRLVIPSTAQSPVRVLGSNANGFAVENVSVYQSNHPAPAAGWAPAAYPVVFDCAQMTGPVIFRNILVQAARRLVRCVNVGRPIFNTVYGHFFDNAIAVDQCLDDPEFNYIRGFPIWSQSQYVYAYTQANCDLLRLSRCDTPNGRHLFNILGRSVLRFSDSGNGVCTGFKFADIDADACLAGVLVDATCDGTRGTVKGHIGVLRHGATSYTGSGAAVPGSASVLDNGTGVHLSVDYFESGFTDSAVQQNGSGGALYLAGADVTYWSKAPGKSTSPAIVQRDTGGQNPNKVFIANRPFFANDVNTTIAPGPMAGDGVVEGIPPVGWLPVFTPGSGVFSSQPTVNAAVYTRRSGEITCTLDYTIPSASIGTASGALTASLPYANGGYAVSAAGEEAAVQGTPVFARMGPNATAIGFVDSANGSIIKGGYRVWIRFTYLAAVS